MCLLCDISEEVVECKPSGHKRSLKRGNDYCKYCYDRSKRIVACKSNRHVICIKCQNNTFECTNCKYIFNSCCANLLYYDGNTLVRSLCENCYFIN